MRMTSLRKGLWFKISLLALLIVAACTPPLILPTIANFSADPATIAPGDTSTLSWNVSDADSVSITTPDGEVTTSTEAQGTVEVAPAATTTYTLTATNSSGSSSETVTVTVGTTTPGGPEIVAFTATPGMILEGASSTLAWSVTDADEVVITAGETEIETSTDAEGSVTVTPAATTTYTLTATNSEGESTATVTVTVNAPGEDASIGNLTATIQRESMVELTWDSTNATGFEIYSVANDDSNDVALIENATASPHSVPIPASNRQTIRVVAVGTGANAEAEVTLTNVVTNSDDYDVYDSLGFTPELVVAGSLRQVVDDATSGSIIGFASDVTTVNMYGVELSRLVTGADLVDAHLILPQDVIISAPASGVTIRALTPHPELDEGEAIEWRSRMVAVGPDATVLLENLTLTGGTFVYAGGGIINFGDLTLVGSTVTDNRSWYNGGGIYNAVGATIELIDTSVTGNVSAVLEDEVDESYQIRGRAAATINITDGGYGGGIYNLGQMTIGNGTEVNNNTAKIRGGAIHNQTSGVATITGSSIVGNVADSTIYGDSTLSNWGGGIFNTGAMNVADTDITGNRARYNGGGLLQTEDGTGVLAPTTIFSNNTAQYGGAISHMFEGDPSNLDFSNDSDAGDNTATDNPATDFYHAVDTTASTPIAAEGRLAEPSGLGSLGKW